MAEDSKTTLNEQLFLQIVSMFQFAAMQQMGKLLDPATNEVERDLVQAKASIDILEMLQAKTKGNLSDGEAEFLKKILFELQMNYVDEVKQAEEEKKKGEAGESEETEPAASDNKEETTEDESKATDKDD